jgi:CO/xanthine dehydrogenase FAD-binding subunit
MTTLAYLRPVRLDEALRALAQRSHAVLAGGTDFYPARVGKPVDVDILDITRLPDLRAIQVDNGAVRIGATVTWSELMAADLPPVFDALKAAAREVGGVQIQNAGTLAGNLCNASPAADGVPPLLALDAEVELMSLRGPRRLPLADFVLGSRKTARAADELVVAVHVPAWPSGSRSAFLKLGHRRYLVISIAMVAATVALDQAGRIARCAVAVGACSAVAQRLPALERKLLGVPAGSAAALVDDTDLAPIAPIADVRGTAEYRRDAALTLVRRALGLAVAR